MPRRQRRTIWPQQRPLTGSSQTNGLPPARVSTAGTLFTAASSPVYGGGVREADGGGLCLAENTTMRYYFAGLSNEKSMVRRLRKDELRSQRLAKKLRSEMTLAEVILWSYLRPSALNEVRFRRQHPVGPYVGDFACVRARLIVEVDGATHSTADGVRHDRIRDAYLRRRGWRVLRVTNTDVLRNLDGVLDAIIDCARRYRPPPSVFAASQLRRTPPP